MGMSGGAGPGGLQSEINVTPMVDIMLVLLIIFMVVTPFLQQGITVALPKNLDHPEVDHVELFGPTDDAAANSRSFVLCPGNAYDRSPCGTGTSAKLACLAADGKLAERATWVQESIIGSRFKASYRWLDDQIGDKLGIPRAPE